MSNKDSTNGGEPVAPNLTQQIADLAVNQSISFAERLEGDAATKEAINAARKRMSNVVSAPVQRVRKRTGQEYHVERGEFFTRRLDLLVVIVVTRVS